MPVIVGGGGSIAPLVVNGNFLQTPAGGGIDTNAAGLLAIGNANATSVVIGPAGKTTTFNLATGSVTVAAGGLIVTAGGVLVSGTGSLQVAAGGKLDTSAAGALNIGSVNATTIAIGNGATTTVGMGNFIITPGGNVVLDTAGGALLGIGTVNAPTITIGRTGQLINFAAALTAAGTGAAPTLPANTPTGATGGALKFYPCQIAGVASYLMVAQ